MTNQSTIDKLIEMRLTTMADAFRNQLADPKFREVPFEDRFGMLVDIEYSNRKNNRLKRLIHNAGFDQPEANIIDIWQTDRRPAHRDYGRSRPPSSGIRHNRDGRSQYWQWCRQAPVPVRCNPRLLLKGRYLRRRRRCRTLHLQARSQALGRWN